MASETFGLYFIVQLPSGYIPVSTEKFIWDSLLKCLSTWSSDSSGRGASPPLLSAAGTRGSLPFAFAHSLILGSSGTRNPSLPFLPISERRGSSQNACLNLRFGFWDAASSIS